MCLPTTQHKLLLLRLRLFLSLIQIGSWQKEWDSRIFFLLFGWKFQPMMCSVLQFPLIHILFFPFFLQRLLIHILFVLQSIESFSQKKLVCSPIPRWSIWLIALCHIWHLCLSIINRGKTCNISNSFWCPAWLFNCWSGVWLFEMDDFPNRRTPVALSLEDFLKWDEI